MDGTHMDTTYQGSTHTGSTAEDAFLLARRKSALWRIHLWAAFIATPFALIGALTGMLYIFTPQIEAVLHGRLDTVTPGAARLPLDELVAGARRAAPAGASLRYVVTPDAAQDSLRVYFSPAGEQPRKPQAEAGEHAQHAGHGRAGGAPATQPQAAPSSAKAAPAAQAAAMDHRLPQGHIVYVDPYTGRVLGLHGEMDRFSTWSKRVHSSLLQGNDWRWMLELATSWLVVMLLTGLYLWWPRGGQTAVPRAGLRGRLAWRQWHAFTGVALSVLTLIVLSTGLTWSRHAGDQIKAAADWAGQGTPALPKGLRSQGAAGQPALAWQQVWDAALGQAPKISMQINPPRRADEPWRISNFDRSQPTRRFNLLLDGHTGQALHYRGWQSMTLFNQATAIGIPFHRGEFGWWNQALLLVFGLGVIWGLVSGWVMYFTRHRHGALGLPRLLPGAWRSLPLGAWLAALPLLWLMPLLAASAAAIAFVEMGMAWRGAPGNAPSP
jgi:uncharacterized iron-regulated membrane protein